MWIYHTAMDFGAARYQFHGLLKYLNGEKTLHRRRVTQQCSRICAQSGRGVRGERVSEGRVEESNSFDII